MPGPVQQQRERSGSVPGGGGGGRLRSHDSSAGLHASGLEKETHFGGEGHFPDSLFHSILINEARGRLAVWCDVPRIRWRVL